ncbi:hypothetical protein I5K76_21665, partial [Pseudomonas aeruginosa]|nr:hypothetical protein [Pseudomonas aeruginosa]
MNAEAIVVGAGIVGAACAEGLGRRGRGVVVVDCPRGGAPAAGGGARGGG